VGKGERESESREGKSRAGTPRPVEAAREYAREADLSARKRASERSHGKRSNGSGGGGGGGAGYLLRGG